MPNSNCNPEQYLATIFSREKKLQVGSDMTIKFYDSPIFAKMHTSEVNKFEF